MALTRNALWLARLGTLTLLSPESMFAADALPAAAEEAPATPVFAQADVDAPPAPVLRPLPQSPPGHQPLFGAQLLLEFVVDAQGVPRDVKLLEAKATLAASGRIFQESDLPVLRRLGVLDGTPAYASFREISDLLTKPFLEPGKDAVLKWRYRPGRKAGAEVATRITDSVVFLSDDLLPPESRRTIPPQASRPPVPIEPTPPVQTYRPPEALEPTRSIIAVIPTPGSSSVVNTPGLSPTTIMATAGGGSIIQTPGQPPSTVVPTLGGGSTIYTPGQPPTTIMPTAGGGSIIQTPGQPPSTVVPTPGGGSTIYTHGQPPTTVVPTAGGGSVIYVPGQPPVVVMPDH